MQFTVSSSAFYARITIASKVLASKNTMPIMECFMVEVKNGQVSVTASDGEKYLVTRTPLIDSDNNCKFCVTAKLLLDSMKELPEQPLTIRYDPDTMEIRGLHQTGNFSLLAQDAALYPQTPVVTEGSTTLQMPTDAVVKGLNLCFNATSDEELRMIMTCVCMDIHGDNVTFAATDGRKLVRHINSVVQPGIESQLIFPKKVAQILRSTLGEGGEVKVTYDTDRALVQTADMDFQFRLVEGSYLNYNAVISATNPYMAMVDRQSLLAALKRVSVFCKKSNGLAKLHIENGSMQLTSQDEDYRNKAEENLLCTYDNAPISIGFNCFYMIEIVSVMDSEHVNVMLADPGRPALITPAEQTEGEDTLMLLMPMMLNE